MKRFYKFSFASLVAVGGLTAIYFSSEEARPKYQPAQATTYEAGANGAAQFYQDNYSDPATGEVPYEYLREQRELAGMQSASRASQVGLEFKFTGPNNVGGRTRAILVDNEDPDRLYAAGITGGLFISINGGNSWSATFQDKESMNISCITQADNGTLYIGTGCSFELEGSSRGGGPQSPGTGVYKSTNRGDSWTKIESTDPTTDDRFSYINDILVIPSNANQIVVATAKSAGSGGGILTTTDGGANWAYGTCIPTTTLELKNEGNSLTLTGDGKKVLAATTRGSNNSIGAIFAATVPLRGENCEFELVQGADSISGLTASRERLLIRAAKYTDSEMNTISSKVYIAAVTDPGHGYGGIYVSDDNGETFAPLSPDMPVSSSTWDLFGEKRDPGRAGAQGWYDFSFAVAPNDEEKLFIGGVQFWRYDGNWTRATRDYDFGIGDNLYSHVDQHTIAFDPNDPNLMFLGNDGGIYKSLDGGYTYWNINRGYQTTQFYDVEASPEGLVVGGTQDNGVFLIDPNSSGVADFGYNVSNQNVVNGDGFDVAISQIVDAKVTSAQFNNIGRSQISSTTGAGICDTLCGAGPFDTRLGFWESLNDEYSRDSIEFSVDTSAQKIDIGNGVRRTFSGKLEPAQASAQIDYSSLSIGTIDQRAIYDGNGGFTGAGTGTLDEATGEFEVSLNFSPTQNALINAYYAVNYPAGATITLFSATEGLEVEAVLHTNLAPGDVIKIQDPVQSILVMASISDGGTAEIAMVRGVINFQDDERNWMRIPITGTASAFEFSADGRSLYFGTTGGSVYRMDNVDQLYDASDVGKESIIRIANVSGRVTSINVHPTDEETILFTTSQFGGSHVYTVSNAQSALNQGTAQLRDVQSDLPDLPVFDGLFNVSDPSIVVLGTDYGIYATSDINANPVEWTLENDFGRIEFPNVPVYSLYQQKLGYTEASNYHVIYAGTHGRGVWQTGSLVGVEEIAKSTVKDGEISALDIYPNPMREQGRITFESATNNANTRLEIYDINGTLVQARSLGVLEQGENEVMIHTQNFPVGTYIVSIKNDVSSQVGKFVVTR